MYERETRTAVRDIVYNHDAVGATVVSRSNGPEAFLTCQKLWVRTVRIGSLAQTCCIPLEARSRSISIYAILLKEGRTI